MRASGIDWREPDREQSEASSTLFRRDTPVTMTRRFIYLLGALILALGGGIMAASPASAGVRGL